MKTLIVTLLLISQCFAFDGGDKVGGGGDSLEARVDEIRVDILNWINRGGALSLVLKENLTLSYYEQKMKEILEPQKVIISFVENNDSTDEELKVIVQGAPKTCRGFISKKDHRPHILCHVERFKNASESEQYQLIHHEFAGLAGIEINKGAASDYSISTQLNRFLKYQATLKLAIVMPRPSENTSFNPLKILDEARILYEERMLEIEQNQLKIQSAKNQLKLIEGKLLSHKFTNQAINDQINLCAQKLRENSDLYAKKENEAFVNSELKKLQLQFNQLKDTVNKYLSLSNCKSCDNEILLEIEETYRKHLEDSIYNFKDVYSFKISEFKTAYVVDKAISNTECSFEQFFKVTYSKKFNYVVLNSLTEKVYFPKLNPEELINGQFDKTLDYIAKNAPIQVILKANLFGKPKSYFNKNTVYVATSYDINGDSMNIFEPDLTNPIHIIQDYINKN
ncbi:MAG: hypothetical protein AB7I27_05580 [Bacteriovoracaceae bacterium]